MSNLKTLENPCASHNLPPKPAGQTGVLALREMLKSRSILSALDVFHQELGDIFQIDLPGFKPVVFSGPDASRFVLVTHRDDMLWRVEPDPVVDLLGQGVLVQDGMQHDRLRGLMNSVLHRRMMADYIDDMVKYTDQISSGWSNSGHYDMLVEMRKIALLVLVSTLFSIDMTSDLDRMWAPILKILKYISPGLWMLWRGIPRWNYGKAKGEIDDYLYGIIHKRRELDESRNDLLGALLSDKEMDDKLLRDQMLTMLIAGHDTSTAMLAWVLYLLTIHVDVMRQVQDEVDAILGDNLPTLENIADLDLLTRVIKETLRLYPPIHAGNRIVKSDLEFNDRCIYSGSRLIYSIYLTHRDPEYWFEPNRFDPGRFSQKNERERSAYSYLPFGGGPRNCIGAGYAMIEGKVILARLLQKYDFSLLDDNVHPHMGATLEPRPGVIIGVTQRKPNI